MLPARRESGPKTAGKKWGTILSDGYIAIFLVVIGF
jgi:hypothetical protein